jgi:ATP-dependent helicase/nuclease subunit A
MREKVKSDGGAVLKIDRNFRSEQAILMDVNRIFQGLMPPAPDPQRPYLASYDALLAVRHHGDQPRVWARIAPDHGKASDRRRQESFETAAVVFQAVSQGWPVWDRGQTTERPLTYKDIAILMPNRTGIDAYRQAFRDRGIPLASIGGVGFFHQDEIRGFSALLTALADPDDEVAWLAFFLSPWVGASPADVKAYQADGQRLGGFGGLPDTPLGQWHREVATWSQHWDDWLPVDVFDALVAYSDLYSVLAERQDWQAMANLAKLREMSRIQGKAWGMGGFETWLRQRVASGQSESEGVVEKHGDAVLLSTVHQAKGLEWPMCVVTNWHIESHPLPHLLHNEKTGGVAWRTPFLAMPQYDAYKAASGEREQAERLRVLYVALTRAKDYLVLIERFAAGRPSGFSLPTVLAPWPDPE